MIRLLQRGLAATFRAIRDELFPFLKRGDYRALPPFGTAAAVIAAGLVIPFALPAKERPTALTKSLALQRLETLATKGVAAPPVLPAGTILSPRPAFRWPNHPRAAAYAFELRSGGTVWAQAARLDDPEFRLRPPGRLQPDRDYTFTVRALDAAGAPLAWPDGAPALSGAFRLRPPPEDFAALEARAYRELPREQAALVVAGYCAENGTPSDVLATLLAYRATAEGGPGVSLADRILAQLAIR